MESMETDLVLSLRIAREVMVTKKAEAEMLVYTLQNNPRLSDELIALFAEFWNMATRKIEALEQAINSLEEQKSIFGKTGLIKELQIVPKENYPDNQQPQDS
ncbi:MAG: hypothetical protein Q7K65_03775 [Candidatus Buchananbacteria bacterium]|nr:hypothetical protein [Candidatus Buchananbacteria bacterium]